MHKLTTVLITVMLIFAIGCAPSAKFALTIADIEPKLAAYGGHSIGFAEDSEDGLVTYIQIGDPVYDSFFKSTAKLDGMIILSGVMSSTATGELKKFAMSKAASGAMKDNIKELVGDTPPDQWTTEQSIAVLKMAKGQDQINSDEMAYFSTTAISIGIAVVSLGKGVVEAKNLIPKGQELLKNVKSLKMTLVPAATKGLKGSIENLNGVVNNTPRMLEEMKVLLDGFKALS